MPWDGGTTNRAGARHGPREIRNMSSFMRKVHHVSRIAPYDLARIADLGDAPVNPIDLMDTLGRVEKFYAKVHAAGAVPLSAGGDHLITLPIYARHRRQDASAGHGAFRRPQRHLGHAISAATNTPMARRSAAPSRRGCSIPKRTVQIGIRGSIYSPDDMSFAENSGMRVIYMEEFVKLGAAKVIEITRRVMGDGPTYISFDVDGLDPVYAPGTGTPEIGGMTTREGQEVVRGLQGLNLVGGDVVEVSPPFDPSGNTALVGATFLFEIMCLLADAVARRRSRG